MYLLFAALEFSQFGITVNNIAPGATRTDINRDVWDYYRRLQEQAMSKKRPLIVIAFVSVLSLTPSLAAADPAPSRWQHFITRRGDRLHDGEQEFRFIGANVPGLVLPYDWTLYLPERLHLPTPWEQEDGFKTLDQMNLRVVRTWNLPIRGPQEEAKSWHYVLGPGQFNEEAFKTVDHLFALANEYNVPLIFDLTAESGDYLGGIGSYAAHRNKKQAGEAHRRAGGYLQ